MLLNSEQILEFIIDPLNLAIKQQVGIDLTVEVIKKIKGDNERYLGTHCGNVLLKEKTHIQNPDITYELIPLKEKLLTLKPIKFKKSWDENLVKHIYGWFLEKGAYSLTFNQGCKLPNYIAAKIEGRSSLNRLGCRVQSGRYDPGFETEQMGATLYVEVPILIEYRARVAQIIMEQCVPTDNIYNGQYQKEKDIK